MACVRGRGVCAHHKKATVRQRLKVPAHERAKPPLDAVPGDRRANRPAHHESYAGRFLPVNRVLPHQQVAHHAGPARTGPGAHGQRELRAAAHPGLGRQDQALSRSRPLRLRAARMARPARVRMRSRKPCVLARRRLFGWNVRLLTGTPGQDLVAVLSSGFASVRPGPLPAGPAGTGRHRPLLTDAPPGTLGRRAVLGFTTGYHPEPRRLPAVPR